MTGVVQCGYCGKESEYTVSSRSTSCFLATIPIESIIGVNSCTPSFPVVHRGRRILCQPLVVILFDTYSNLPRLWAVHTSASKWSSKPVSLLCEGGVSVALTEAPEDCLPVMSVASAIYHSSALASRRARRYCRLVCREWMLLALRAGSALQFQSSALSAQQQQMPPSGCQRRSVVWVAVQQPARIRRIVRRVGHTGVFPSIRWVFLRIKELKNCTWHDASR